MDESRPDYVPPRWRGGPANRWLAATPGRMLGWYAGSSFVAVAIFAWAALDPHYFVDNIIPIAAVVGAVRLLAQAAIYAPRAFRATRRRRAGEGRLGQPAGGSG